jgi:hypothetical protein
MKKIYQPFIIEKAGLILDVLKDDVSITDFTMDRMCDLLTDKFISGDLSSDDPIQEIFNEKELLLYINEMEIHKDLDHLIELELIDYFVDDNEGLLIYFMTEKGKKYVDELKKG